MSKKVFISGSISIKSLPASVKESIKRIKEENIEVLIGDADGIDSIIQKYCNRLNYFSVTVYSIYSVPRFMIKGFKSKLICPTGNSKKERVRQKEKDIAMTKDCDFCLVVWDGKSKGSYDNILRALENNKKLKIFLATEGLFMESPKINKTEIEYIYRKNNGYSASEIVEYLKGEGEDYFQQTRAFNKCLLDHKIIRKESGVYVPMPGYEKLFIIDKYRGKVKGIKFTNEFIDWVEEWLKNIKPPVEQSLF